MIRHKSSLILIMPPKGGIGPGTVSGLTGLTLLLHLNGPKRNEPE
jgi:hypothetical protein